MIQSTTRVLERALLSIEKGALAQSDGMKAIGEVLLALCDTKADAAKAPAKKAAPTTVKRLGRPPKAANGAAHIS